jgi:hypothetical protein
MIRTLIALQNVLMYAVHEHPVYHFLIRLGPSRSRDEVRIAVLLPHYAIRLSRLPIVAREAVQARLIDVVGFEAFSLRYGLVCHVSPSRSEIS